MREKLIELIRKADKEDYESRTQDEHYAYMADHLIANGVTIQKWIPVSERLPEKIGQYICRYVFGENEEYPFHKVLYYCAQLEKPHFQYEGELGLRVTHWMPLPEMPKGDRNELP